MCLRSFFVSRLSDLGDPAALVQAKRREGKVSRVGEFARPMARQRKVNSAHAGPGSWKTADGKDWRHIDNCDPSRSVDGFNFHSYEKTGQPGGSFQTAAVLQAEGVKQRGSGPEWFDKALDERRREASAAVLQAEGGKGFVTGLGRGHDWRRDPSARFNSKSSARKAASAQIAKIPFALSSHIARGFRPS